MLGSESDAAPRCRTLLDLCSLRSHGLHEHRIVVRNLEASVHEAGAGHLDEGAVLAVGAVRGIQAGQGAPEPVPVRPVRVIAGGIL